MTVNNSVAARLKWADPVYRARHKAAMVLHWRSYYDDPLNLELHRLRRRKCAHPYYDGNVMHTSQGTVRCRTCYNAWRRSHRVKKRSKCLSS